MLTTRLTMMVVFAPPDLAFPVAHIGGVSKSKLAHQTPNTHDPCELTYSREAETAYCMKGRYQLANFAKFNRPDPMRDWDWENPSSINLYQYVRNNPIDSWDPTGLIVDESRVEGEILWYVLKSAVLATDYGRQLWDQLQSATAIFRIDFKNLSKGYKTLGKVENYVANEKGELSTVDINFDPGFFLWQSNTVPGGKEGYEDAMDHGKRILNLIVGVAHEFKHAVDALDSDLLQKKILQERWNKLVGYYLKKYGGSNNDGYKGSMDKLKYLEGEVASNNAASERSGVDGGNSVGYEFNKLQWKERRRHLREVKKAIKEYRKNEKSQSKNSAKK